MEGTSQNEQPQLQNPSRQNQTTPNSSINSISSEENWRKFANKLTKLRPFELSLLEQVEEGPQNTTDVEIDRDQNKIRKKNKIIIVKIKIEIKIRIKILPNKITKLNQISNKKTLCFQLL